MAIGRLRFARGQLKSRYMHDQVATDDQASTSDRYFRDQVEMPQPLRERMERIAFEFGDDLRYIPRNRGQIANTFGIATALASSVSTGDVDESSLRAESWRILNPASCC